MGQSGARLALAALALAACGESHAVLEGDAGAPDGGAPPRARLEKVDVLFVIENGAGAWGELGQLAAAMPAFGRVLTAGDVDGDEREDRASVHARVGVITTDMGSGGFDVPTCGEPRFGDDARLRTTAASTPSCPDAYPPFLTLVEPGDIDGGALAGCLVVQPEGCGWERHLDAMLKAVTENASPLRFQEDTPGHADGANAGFFRDDALLAVVVFSEEDDLSSPDPAFYELDSARYPSSPALRGHTYPDALHPVSRYVDGLLAAKGGDPSLVFFAVLGGIPARLTGDGPTDYGAILADRDMQERLDPESSGRLAFSCHDPGLTLPPRRILETARALSVRAVATRAESICQDDFAPAMRRIATAILDAAEAPW